MPFPLDKSSKEAIQDHFRQKSMVWEEDFFIQILKQSDNRWDVYWATIALRDCGTKKAIPALKENIYYPVRDVKSTSLLTIAHIGREKETPFYATCLLDPKYREKAYAMWAINDAADRRGVAAVLEYFKKNKSKLKAGKLHSKIVIEGLDFLSRHIFSSEELKELCQAVIDSWSKLDDFDRRQMIERLKVIQEFKAARGHA